MRIALGSDIVIRRQVVDDLMDCFVAWREAGYAVDLATRPGSKRRETRAGPSTRHASPLDLEEQGPR
jgi:hypothetical protein